MSTGDLFGLFGKSSFVVGYIIERVTNCYGIMAMEMDKGAITENLTSRDSTEMMERRGPTSQINQRLVFDLGVIVDRNYYTWLQSPRLISAGPAIISLVILW